MNRVIEEAKKYYKNDINCYNAFLHGVEWCEDNFMTDGSISDYKSEWISVKDRLPEQDEEVIAVCNDLNIASFYKISFAHIVDKTICQDYNGWNIPNVVYWFPMPKLPKEKEIKL